MVLVVCELAIVSHLASFVEVEAGSEALTLLESTPVEVACLVVDNYLYFVLTRALRGEGRAQLCVVVAHPLPKIACLCPQCQKLHAVATLVSDDLFQCLFTSFLGLFELLQSR